MRMLHALLLISYPNQPLCVEFACWKPWLPPKPSTWPYETGESATVPNLSPQARAAWTLEASIFAPRKAECESRDFYDTPALESAIILADWEEIAPGEGYTCAHMIGCHATLTSISHSTLASHLSAPNLHIQVASLAHLLPVPSPPRQPRQSLF